MRVRCIATAAAVLALGLVVPAATRADDRGDALLAVPRTLVRLNLPELALESGPFAASSVALRAPAAHQQICAWAIEAYGATLDQPIPSCQTAGVLGIFEADFLRRVIHPLLIAANLLDGRMPGTGPAGDAAPAEPSEPFTLGDPGSRLRLRPTFMGFSGATLRATILFR